MPRTCLSSARWCGASSEATSEPGPADVADPGAADHPRAQLRAPPDWDGPILLLLSVVLIPIALAIAIVRYQLFDIRVVLSRTLLYGLTIAVVIADLRRSRRRSHAPGAIECPAKRLRRRGDHCGVPVRATAVPCAADDQPRVLRHPVRPRPNRVADRRRAASTTIYPGCSSKPGAPCGCPGSRCAVSPMGT